MERKIVLKQDILDALEQAGVGKGQTIMVHTSLSSLGFVCGGAQIVIEALLESVGTDGTIMMPTQSWKNLDPTAGVHWEEPEEWWQIIRDNWPAYNRTLPRQIQWVPLRRCFANGLEPCVAITLPAL